MTKMSYIEAIQNAQDLAMEKDNIFILGEDVGRKGGVFGATWFARKIWRTACN